MNFDANDYNITVRRVIVDGTAMFEARVTELPDIRGYAGSAGEAHGKAIEAIEALHEMAVRDHEDFPAPTAPEDEYSGRVTLRMSKTMHRDAALRAIDEGVSLNSYIVECIAARSRAGVAIQPVAEAPVAHLQHPMGDKYKYLAYSKYVQHYSKYMEQNTNIVITDAGGSGAGVLYVGQIAMGTATQSPWEVAPAVPEYWVEKRRQA